MGVSNAWGWNSWNNKTIYFDNSLWASDDYTPQLLIGRYYTWGSESRGSSAMSLTKIQNTDLWYLKDFTYSNYTSQYFIANATTWGNEYGCNSDGCENTPEHRYKYATHYTNSYNTDGDSKYNLFIPESKDNNATLAYYHNSNYSTLLNYDQTVQQHLSTNGSEYAASIVSIATVKVSSYKLSNATTVAEDSKTIASGSSSATCSAARTATVTYTVSGVNTGYKFVGWYDGNTQKSTNTTYTYQATTAKTITARFEKTYAVTISADANGTVSPTGSQQVGSTSVTIKATANTGYKFKNWTKTGGVVIDNANNATTTITATATGTVTANFEEDLSSNWKLIGDNQTNSPFGDNYTYSSGKAMTKKSGHSTESNVYITLDIKHLPANYYGFKVATSNSDNDKYGYGTGEGHYITFNRSASNSQKQVYSGSQHELKFIPDALGEYEFRVNYPSNKYVYVTFPTAYTVTFGKGTGGGSVTAKYNSTSFNSGTKVQSGKTVTFTQSASAGYTFKEWNTKSDGTGTQLSTNATYTHTVAATNTVYAIYMPNKYTVKFNPNGGTGSMADQAFIYGTEQNLTANAFTNIGYSFNGWNTNAAGTGTTYDDQASVNNLTTTNNGTVNLYAQWTEIKHTITIKSNDNTFGIVSPSSASVGQYTAVSITATSKIGYVFKNWTATDGITITNAHAAITTIKATQAGTVTANFEAQPATTVYLKTTANWKDANARFAIYYWGANSQNGWVNMTEVDCNRDYFKGEIPYGSTGFNFVRMNPSKPENNWNNDWNQTGNMIVPTDSKNCFTITNDHWGEQDPRAEGTWAAYNPTVTLTLKSSSNGIFRVRSNGKTYESSLTEDVQIELPLNATITVIDANLPNPGYYLKEHFIKIGTNEKEETSIDVTHELCGNTTISANFVTKRPFNVYLKPNSDWKQSSPVFATYMYDEAGNNQWIRMTQVGDYYTCVIPKGWSNINIARLKPSGTDGYTSNNSGLDWDNKWNQTSSLPIPVTRINAYVIDNSGTSTTNAQGHWADVATTAGDYRLLYVEQVVEKDKNNKTIITRKYEHPSDVIKKRSTTGIDTVSLHVYNQNRYNATYKWEGETSLTYDSPSNSAVILQQYDGSKWVDLDNQHHMIFGPLEAHQYTAMLPGRRNATAEDEPLVAQLKADYGIRVIKDDTHEDKGNGVWNFPIQQTVNGGNTTVELMRKDVHRYTGEYYIRTDNAAGGWQNYTHRNNHMTFSSYSKHNSHFSHYYCKWVDLKHDPWNVKFTIANDYGYSISDPLDGDDFVPKTGEHQGQLQENANIRWSWNMVNNKVHRAYIQGAYNPDTHKRLKNIVIDYTTDGTTDPGDLTLGDSGDWIYKIDVEKVKNGATLKQLTATYPSKTINGIDPIVQVFEDNLTMLTGENTTNEYIVRVLYDFKIDKTLVTLVPNENAADINIDLLIERIDQGDATQVKAQVNSTRANDEGFTAYAVTSFTKEYVNNAANKHFREFYWVSFPFDVQISDVFGFGEYGVHWIMQYYDGEERAKKGCWVDSPTYWRFITDTTGNDWNNGILKANHGYVLTLDLDLMAETSPVFANSDTVSLYFPSMNQVNKLQIGQTSAPTYLEAYNCTIQRDNRYLKDSHWHLIGLPSYANTDEKTVNDDTEFLYIYNSDDTYTAKSTSENFDFKSLHAYMVQYTGNITWHNIVAEVPSQLAAKRSSDNKTRYSLRLEMQQNGNYADQTFVKLQDENVTEAFDFNKDLTKLINAGANIYTFTNDQIEVAGNVMPIAETIIPVGVKITAAGEYTFAMPDGTDGIVVELIDYENNTRTNMLLDSYTVNLEKGTFDNRFALHIKPNKTATGVDNIGNETTSDTVKKYLIDGILYMQKDGVLYDAQGKLVR